MISQKRRPEQGYLVPVTLRFLRRHGPALLALTCVFLFFLSHFNFFWSGHEGAIALVGVGAVIGILYEIRLALEHGKWPKGTFIYGSMREARADLVGLIVNEITRGRGDDIVILGTRFRSIADILREVRSKITTQGKGKTVRLRLYAMNPALASRLPLPGARSDAQRDARNQKSACYTKAAMEDLADQETWPGHIQITVTYYDEIPSSYFFLIGRDQILQGGVLWDETKADLDGPGTPCWRLTRDAREFEMVAAWLHNRADYLDACAANNLCP